MKAGSNKSLQKKHFRFGPSLCFRIWLITGYALIDLAALVPLLREKVASIGLFGASREVFEAAFTGVVPVFHEPTLRAAMTRLYAEARPGDVMLLSPATSSFDLYPNYKARGRDFQAVFADLPGTVRTSEGGGA